MRWVHSCINIPNEKAVRVKAESACAQLSPTVCTLTATGCAQIPLQVVHTDTCGCAHERQRMCIRMREVHKYTIALHKYAKLTAWESCIWARILFWMKNGQNFSFFITGWCSAPGWCAFSLGMRLAQPWDEVRWGMYFFCFFTWVGIKCLRGVPKHLIKCLS